MIIKHDPRDVPLCLSVHHFEQVWLQSARIRLQTAPRHSCLQESAIAVIMFRMQAEALKHLQETCNVLEVTFNQTNASTAQ